MFGLELTLPVVFVSIVLINLVPFMPPTWAFLSFVYITQGGNLIVLAVLGAVASTLGRVGLSLISKKSVSRVLSKRHEANLKFIKSKLGNWSGAEFVFTFLYSLSPFPSSTIFIVAGGVDLDIIPIAAGFFIGRVISYFLLISAAGLAVEKLRPFLSLSNPYTWAIDILGIALSIAFFFIDWKSLFNEFKFKKQTKR